MSDDMIQIDDKELTRLIKWFEFTGPKKLIPDTIRGFVNDMAFNTKNTSKKTMDKVFEYKNSSSKRYLESAVSVQKSPRTTIIENIESIVGVRSGGENTRKNYKREITARQEEGGKLKQIKTSGDTFRDELFLPAANQAPKKNIRFRNRGLIQMNSTISNPKNRMAASLKTARDKRRPFAVTPYGIYRVFSKRAEIVRVFKPKKSVVTKPNPWLKPAEKIEIGKKDRVFKKNLNRQLRKHKMK